MKQKSSSLLTLSFALLSSMAWADSTLIQNVRVFDGVRVLEKQNVLIKNGKIHSLNYRGQTDQDALKVDGTGKTLLPGLIDAHVHAFKDQDLPLLFGVTTELDMFSIASGLKQYNADLESGKDLTKPDIYSAGVLATVPGGHGTEYGFSIDTLTKPEQALAFVDARIREGSHFIKIVMEPGNPRWGRTPSLDLATVEALIKATHARKKLAVVHISNYQDALDALRLGADGLVHLFHGDELSEAEQTKLVKLAQSKRAFVIPTLSVIESIAGIKPHELLSDKAYTDYLNKTQVLPLKSSFGKTEEPALLIAPNKLIAALAKAGVPILAGTDAGNPGTQYGASVHHELRSLVNAGLTPLQALASATSVPAQAFKLHDRGRIRDGLRADLVLVEGEPDRDISATRRIVAVWKNGHDVSALRTSKAAQVQAERAQAQQAIALPADGRISQFSSKRLAAPFGLGWMPSSDQFMGGKSVVKSSVIENALDGQNAVEIEASVNPGFAYPWAGLTLMPGAQPMAAVDLSNANTLKFKVRGDGQRYTVSFAIQGSFVPVTLGFATSDQWTEVVLPFSKFKGLDPSIVTMLSFNAGPTPGNYRFQVADVRLVNE